jgi:predicted ATPase
VRLARGGLDAIKALPDGPERDERELGLQMALGAALQATQGMASSEVERAHSRAQALAEQAVDSPQVFNVLRSLWSFHVVRADVERGRALAEELLRMADAKGDADLQLIGHHALGFSLSTLGEDVQAIEHLERGLALHDPKRFRRDTFAFAIDSGVACACQVALPLWRTGNPDRALRRSVEATALAEKVAGPYNIGFARVFAGMLHQLRREVEATRREAEAALAVGAEHGLMEILAWGSISLGWAMAMQGDAEAGVAHLRGAIGGSAAIGSRIARGQHLVLLAEALERAGRPDEGLTALDDALAAVAQSGECYCEPEIHRLRGQLLMAQAGADAAPRAEAAFRQAIDVARRLGAPSYELTAGTSLARLLHEQRRQDEARSLLSPILGAFSEGFETTPLIQAKEVLATLG